MSLQEIRHSVSKTEEHILSPYSWHFTIEQLLTCSPSRHHCTHPLSAGCYGLHWAAVPQYWSEHIPSRNLQLAGELLWAKWHSTSESAGQAANIKKQKTKNATHYMSSRESLYSNKSTWIYMQKLTLIWSTIFRICGSKPMSSILSASSSTRYVHLRRLVFPASRKSMSLPGVAMQISTPLK